MMAGDHYGKVDFHESYFKFYLLTLKSSEVTTPGSP